MTKTDSVMGIGQESFGVAVSIGRTKTEPALAGNLSISFYGLQKIRCTYISL